MVKALALAAILSILGSMGWWLIDTVEANVELKNALDKSLKVNKKNKESIKNLIKLYRYKKAQLMMRDKEAKATLDHAEDLKRRLKNATRTQITVVERECMESDIPLPVLNILRDQTADGIVGADSHEGVSDGTIIRIEGDADV